MNSHQLEIFLSLVEKDFFAETSKKNVKVNLSKDERDVLNERRKNNLFNKKAIWSCNYRIKATDLL